MMNLRYAKHMMPVLFAAAHEHRRRKHEKASVEVKRSKGQIACAECRRLKLRCDKDVPCNSCSCRGCLVICPIGTREVFVTMDKAMTDSGCSFLRPRIQVHPVRHRRIAC
ncbi:hypothetical protein ACEPAG_3369 [Sanghuangporus baumii]